MNSVSRLNQLLAAYQGRITFAQFMAAALYDPEFGYYTRNVKTVGRTGDFSTAATLHPILAKAITHWMLEYGKQTLGSGIWHIIEVGPGSGQMAYWIRKALPFWRRLRVVFHLVEVSPILREQQKKLLTGSGFLWHDSIQEALQHCDGRALIYTNELVDAFPCIQLVRQRGVWEEVVLEDTDEGIRERSTEIISKFKPTDFTILTQLQQAVSGQRCELHESYRAWLTEWMPLWNAGAMLTIDYGEVAGRLYERRPHGSVRAYFQHMVLEGQAVYQRVGQQDLTADVNFSDLEQWGDQLLLKTKFLQTQAEFISERVQSSDSDAERMLLHPDGAGQAFKVFCQVR